MPDTIYKRYAAPFTLLTYTTPTTLRQLLQNPDADINVADLRELVRTWRILIRDHLDNKDENVGRSMRVAMGELLTEVDAEITRRGGD